jgi:UDPglucose 6-dehydrogenase
MNHKMGIIGAGFVGTACETGLQFVANIKVYDRYKDTESLESVLDHSDVLFLCLPTPMNDDRSCNTSIIESILTTIREMGYKEKAVVIKSTVPPGTTERLQREYPEHTFVFNPEFLTERNFINDFLNQDRIILGTVNERNSINEMDGVNLKKVYNLYRDFAETQKNPAGIFEVDSKVAEMLKYVTNSFLATKVSFFNEIYDICKAMGVDFESVIGMLKLDERIGKSHTSVPGFDGKRGWGGSCFPKDLNALVALAEKHEIDALMLEAAWVKNLTVRDEHDWEDLSQVTGKYVKK